MLGDITRITVLKNSGIAFAPAMCAILHRNARCRLAPLVAEPRHGGRIDQGMVRSSGPADTMRWFVSDSNRMLIWMLLFLVAVVAVCVALLPPLRNAFLANELFVGMIFGALPIGIAINFLRMLMKMCSGREQEGFLLSAMAMRSLLDSIRLRPDESRAISRAT